MTLGERILKYRKKVGISQEELADRLNVTRQSISLWETDQTVPSLDSLIALAEIFGISMDELCGIEDKEQPKEKNVTTDEQPQEKQTCLGRATAVLTPTLLKNMRKLSQRKHIISYTISIVCCIILFVGGFLSDSETSNALGAFFLIMIIPNVALLIRCIVVGKKQYRRNLQKYQNLEYKYLFYDDHFMVKTKSDTSESIFLVKYNEINRRIQDKDYLLIFYENSMLPIQTSSISDCANVIMGLLGLNRGSPQDNEIAASANIRESIRVMLLVMFILSLVSLFIAMVLVWISINLSQAHNSINKVTSFMWEFFLMIPLPLTSAILGIVYLKKHYKCKKNIIAGFIMCAILAIYGCFTFIF